MSGFRFGGRLRFRFGFGGGLGLGGLGGLGGGVFFRVDDFDRYGGLKPAGDADRQHRYAKRANRLVDFDLVSVYLEIKLFQNRVGDLLIRYLAVDAILRANRRRNDHGGALERARDDLRLDLLLNFAVAFQLALKLHAAHDARRREAGEIPGDEVVAGVSVRYIGEITDATDVLDVGEEDDFHILNSFEATGPEPGGPKAEPLRLERLLDDVGQEIFVLFGLAELIHHQLDGVIVADSAQHLPQQPVDASLFFVQKQLHASSSRF